MTHVLCVVQLKKDGHIHQCQHRFFIPHATKLPFRMHVAMLLLLLVKHFSNVPLTLCCHAVTKTLGMRHWPMRREDGDYYCRQHHP